MEFLPVNQYLHQNKRFADHPDTAGSLPMCISFYERVGFNPPWICYYVSEGDDLIGMAAFKGKPVDNRVEIAYGTIDRFQNQGIGTSIAAELVKMGLAADADVIITARTLPEENFSTKILRKNNFKLLGTVNDPEDGDVWEWEYQK